MSGSSPEPIATDFASAEVESSPQVPTQSGDDKEAVLKLRPLRLLNDYHAIDVTSLAEDLFIIFTVDRTIQNWKLKVFLVFLLAPYTAQLLKLACAWRGKTARAELGIDVISEAVQAGLFIMFSGYENYIAAAVFVSIMAFQIVLLLGKGYARSLERKAALGSFRTATCLSLFGAAFTFLPLLCHPEGERHSFWGSVAAGFQADGYNGAVEDSEDVHELYDNEAIDAASTVFLWAMAGFGQTAGFDSACIFSAGISYLYIVVAGIVRTFRTALDVSPCGLSGFLWDIVFLYVLWGMLMFDVERGHVNGKIMSVFYTSVKIFVCIVGFAMVPLFWIIGIDKAAIVFGFDVESVPFWIVPAGTAVLWPLMFFVVVWQWKKRKTADVRRFDDKLLENEHQSAKGFEV